MLRRRLLYGGALLVATLFQIFNTTYLAHFLWVLVLCVPVLSLLISLPAMLSCRVTVSAGDAEVPRGGDAHWRIEIANGMGLPLAGMSFTLRTENRLTGEMQSLPAALRPVSSHRILSHPAATDHCGELVCQITRVRVCDCLGLVAFRRPSTSASMLILPHCNPVSVPASAPLLTTAEQSPQAAGRRGEEYELRAYRPGDPLRSIHWKLTAKFDEPVVREPTGQQRPPWLLSFDHAGTPQELDGVLDQVCSLCRALLDSGEVCYVQWAGQDDALRRHPVRCDAELSAALAAVLGDRAAPQRPVPAPVVLEGLAGPVYHLHIPPAEEVTP